VNSIIGEVTVHLEPVTVSNHDLRFAAEELEVLWSFHRFIFNDLLDLKHPLLQDFSGPMLVAPLKRSCKFV